MDVGGVVEAERPSVDSCQGRPWGTVPVRVRPIFSSDLTSLMRSVGPLVDSLYPSGATLLLRRLEDALAGYAVAHVAASVRTDRPIALAAEALKGRRTRKLSTFWVSPAWRRQGIGAVLVESRIRSWHSSNIESVHVTVRQDRSLELMALLAPRGFQRKTTVTDLYGEDRSETILEWRPENLSYPCLTADASLDATTSRP